MFTHIKSLEQMPGTKKALGKGLTHFIKIVTVVLLLLLLEPN